MSKEEKKLNDAMRIFEALSGVDEELLVRSEEKAATGKVVGWRFGKMHLAGSLIAAACVAVVGLGIWTTTGPMFMSKDSAVSYNGVKADVTEGIKNEAAMPDLGIEEAAPEEAEVPAASAEVAPMEDAGNENAGEGKQTSTGITDYHEEASQKDVESGSVESVEPGYAIKESMTLESTIEECGAPLDESILITEAEAEEIPVFGEYIPSNIPSGYAWEEGRVNKDAESGEYNSLHLTWTKGMDSISIIISVESDLAKVANVEETESYDVRLYEIPYVETVPEEYREVFYAPVFLREDLSLEIIEARMKSVTDAGDTDTPRGNFSVLFDNGVLVRFNGRGTAEEIWQMFQSIE